MNANNTIENGKIITLKKAQYKLLEPLASGGQGSIWQVERVDASDGVCYALKIVNLYDLSYNRPEENPPEKMEKLIDYAQAEIDFLASLKAAEQHNIVACLDYGVIEQQGYQLPCMLMPLYQNGDLSCFIKQMNNDSSLLTGQQWLTWFKQLMQALQYMQQTDMQGSLPVHRDIKPKNCLLGADNQLFLIDFGIVRASNETGTTSFVYTFNYCAPEQRLARHIDKEYHSHFYITPAVDIYAAAIVMHELVAGRIRAQGELNDETTQIKHQHALALSKLKEMAIGQVGYLGKVGGLTDKETDYLHRQLLNVLIKEAQPNDTVIMHNLPRLPDYDFISHSLVNLLQHMLSPWPDDRPHVGQVLQQLEDIEVALSPRLDHLHLTVQQTSFSIDEQVIFKVDIAGSGLPETLSWLQVTINEVLVKHAVFERAGNDITLVLTEFDQVGCYEVRLSALVNNDLKIDAVKIEVTSSAKQLWQMGQYEAALMLELKETWLDDWERKAKTTSEKYQLSSVLKRLQQHYPDNNLLLTRFERVEGIKKPSKSFTIKPLFASLLLVTIGAVSGVYYFWGQNPSKPSEKPPEKLSGLIKENSLTMMAIPPDIEEEIISDLSINKIPFPIEMTSTEDIIIASALPLIYSDKLAMNKQDIKQNNKREKRRTKTKNNRGRKGANKSRNTELDIMIRKLDNAKKRRVRQIQQQKRQQKNQQRNQQRNRQKCDDNSEDLVSSC